MSKYGELADLAAKSAAESDQVEPRDAWMRAAEVIFPNSPFGRAKSCPRNAFLALCGTGMVDGIPRGEYTGSVKNKGYATRALWALQESPALVDDKVRLWQIATQGVEVTPNHQLDVVTTLWSRGRIRLQNPED